MIAIFDNIQDAQKLSDEIHLWLTNNCPGYRADKWQEPNKSDKTEKYYIQLPPEYEKIFSYMNEEKIVSFVEKINPLTDKAISLTEKLPDDWQSQTVLSELKETHK